MKIGFIGLGNMGSAPELSGQDRFAALYVNANDFADAFARFPEKPDEACLTMI